MDVNNPQDWGASWHLIYRETDFLLMQIPDISKLAWQLNVALMGVAFSAISLIYNEKYIYYGFITFFFGVISHFFSTWFEFVYSGDEQKPKRARFYYVQIVLILAWIGACASLIGFL